MSAAGLSPAVDADGAMTLLHDRLRGALGVAPTFVVAPEALDSSFGDGAFGFQLDDDLPEPWLGPLVARFGSAESAAAEAAVLALIERSGDPRLTVPALVAQWPSDPTLGPSSAATVTTRPTSPGMLELLGVNPGRTGELLGLFGTTQAALHELPCGAACAEGIIPVVTSAVEQLASDARVEADYARELSWLAGHQPDPKEPVLCHGRYQPGIASGDPECGEPVTVRDWSGAVLAEAEYDVAYTVLAFWAAPFYTATRSEKAGMKMIRDMISNVYRGSYEGQGDIDDERVRFWQVFHAVQVSVDPSVPTDLVPALKKHLKRLAS